LSFNGKPKKATAMHESFGVQPADAFFGLPLNDVGA
jgi:hypothetical protein